MSSSSLLLVILSLTCINAFPFTSSVLYADFRIFKKLFLEELKPEQVLELAVKGMLPKGPLGRQMYKKLYVYAGPDHKHAAQQPKELEIKY